MQHRPLPDRQGDHVCATIDLVAPLAKTVLRRGHAVNAEFTKTYRKQP